MRIAIIGAGWYGAHLALVLKKAGHDVALLEKNPDIFDQISGKFGVRLHAGPHYPRSTETRKSCHRGFEDFYRAYPELIIEHEYSIYGLGKLDAEFEHSKVSQAQFLAVGAESKDCQIINPNAWGYKELLTAINVQEPSIAVGKRLRETFRRYLKQANVTVKCNYTVKKMEPRGDKVAVVSESGCELFDKVINATSFQAFLPTDIKSLVDMDVVYQPCLALVYEDELQRPQPMSFIIMDGWYPCLMPYNEDPKEESRAQKYILTHGKWTIMGSFNDPRQADALLKSLSDRFIETEIKPKCEHEMNRFWPAFAKRFKYCGWKASVLAKIKTDREFRSAVTFEKDNVIHIIPGKVSNIFDVEQETMKLLNQSNVLSQGLFKFVEGGVLHAALEEITEKPRQGGRNTCTLQTYQELYSRINPAYPIRRICSTPFGLFESGQKNEAGDEDHAVSSSSSDVSLRALAPAVRQ